MVRNLIALFMITNTKEKGFSYFVRVNDCVHFMIRRMLIFFFNFLMRGICFHILK